jgi:WD40 repeat protein
VRTTDGADLDCSLERVLRGHTFYMSAIAWSPDDSLLLSSAEHEIKMWDVEVSLIFYVQCT